ncbi:hypothetical protein BU16DRAFT_470007, partial [Lophium mytilinum]
KFSILHLYIVTFPTRTVRRLCYSLMVASTLYYLLVIFKALILCNATQLAWNNRSHCSKHLMPIYIAVGTINVVIDVIVVALPMPILWKLQLPWSRKIGLFAMFSLGGGICVISTFRIVCIARIDLQDFTHGAADLGVWSFLEPALGVVNACLPVLRPIFPRFAPSSKWKNYFSVRIRGSRKTQSSASMRQGPEIKGRGIFPGIAGSRNCINTGFRKAVDLVELLYPLDTINLVGNDIEAEKSISSRESRRSVGSEATGDSSKLSGHDEHGN